MIGQSKHLGLTCNPVRSSGKTPSSFCFPAKSVGVICGKGAFRINDNGYASQWNLTWKYTFSHLPFPCGNFTLFTSAQCCYWFDWKVIEANKENERFVIACSAVCLLFSKLSHFNSAAKIYIKMPAARAARFWCCIVALPTQPNYMPILKKKRRVKYVRAWFCSFKLVQFPSFSFKLVSPRFHPRRLFTIYQRKHFFSTDPKFTCLNKGLFLCINCCGVHTSFNDECESARIKSIEIGDWTEAMLEVSKQHIPIMNYN